MRQYLAQDRYCNYGSRVIGARSTVASREAYQYKTNQPVNYLKNLNLRWLFANLTSQLLNLELHALTVSYIYPLLHSHTSALSRSSTHVQIF